VAGGSHPRDGGDPARRRRARLPPGRRLHHAMRDRASGSASTTTSRWRSPGRGSTAARALLDFDVHHGDGVQAIHWTTRGPDVLDPRERSLPVPGTGRVEELGVGVAAGRPSTSRSSR
jgi:acetoin utilization protein AcuC